MTGNAPSRALAIVMTSPQRSKKPTRFPHHHYSRTSGIQGFTENEMAKRRMTNIEKVTHIMTFSSYGALAECFVMDALHQWSDLIRKASPDNISNGLISGEAWIGVANEIHDRLNTEMLINDPESNEDEL
jgi:hypothetical protein